MGTLFPSDDLKIWNSFEKPFNLFSRALRRYGKDYHYTGQVNKARAIPQSIEPLLAWCQSSLDRRLNGILFNWYDGSLDHYIGAHRDSTTNLHNGAPIVTVSLGQTRVFRVA